MSMKNVLSIDLESWVHRDKIENGSKRKSLDDGSIVKSTTMLLDLLEKYKVKTTFFILGEIFEWYPKFVQDIRKKGHELAYHTHTHRLLTTKEHLLSELEKSSDFLDKFDPEGFRAVQIFLKRDYLRILHDYGFEYDSSIYGSFKLCRRIDGILEIPVSTYGFYGRSTLRFPRNLSSSIRAGEFPFGSGFSIGLLGSKISSFITKVNDKREPAILFIHPWQVCSSPRRLSPLDTPRMLPYYANRYEAIENILATHEFCTMSELAEEIDNGRHY